MRRSVGPVALWLTATAVSIAVASAAIAQAGRHVISDVPIDQRLAQAARVEGTATGLPPGRADDEAASIHDPEVPDLDDGGRDANGAETDGGVPDGEATADHDRAGTVGTLSEVRTYESIGGRAAIDVLDGILEVRWAVPNEGFRVTVERAPDGRELRVEFRSDRHRSRIDLEVGDGGVLRADIDEDDRS